MSELPTRESFGELFRGVGQLSHCLVRLVGLVDACLFDGADLPSMTLLVSKDPTDRCTPNSWGMPSRSVGVNAEGTQFDKQRKATEMLTDGYVSFVILDYWRGTPK